MQEKRILRSYQTRGCAAIGAMPAIHKGPPKLKFSFVPSRKQSVLGGLPAIEALAQEFGLWEKLRALRWLDPRRRRGSRFGPDAMVAQLIYSFVVGGASLADAERVEEDRLARRLVGMARFADESTLGEWLRALSPERLRALWDLIREFVRWVKGRALGARWQHDRRAENFIDDRQVEVSDKEFEGAKWNYAGDLALSWHEFATVRYRAPGELFWRYAFVVCEGGRDAAAVWARHRLKGE